MIRYFRHSSTILLNTFLQIFIATINYLLLSNFINSENNGFYIIFVTIKSAVIRMPKIHINIY